MAKKKMEEIETEKATLVTFCSLKDCHVTPFKKPNGRVGFRIKGNVTEILALLHQNPSVPILDFINRYEAVRSIIFALKGNENGKSTN